MAKILGQQRVNQYFALSGQVLFFYNFKIYSASEITVQKNGIILVLNTDYSVTGVENESGGSIILTSGANIGDIITISGDTYISRDTVFTDGGAFEAGAINDEYDKLDNLISEVVTEFSRIIKLKTFDAQFDTTFTPVPRRALIINQAGDGITMSDFDPDINVSEAKQYAEEAEIYKNAAENASISASSYALTAQGFATAASDSADDAQYWASTIDLSAIGIDILPDTDGTRRLGQEGLRWLEVQTDSLVCAGTATTQTIRPSATNTHDLGQTSYKWRDLHVARDGFIGNNLTVSNMIMADGGIDCLGSLYIDGIEIHPYKTALFKYQVSSGTPGGDATVIGGWETRPINTIEFDNIGVDLIDNGMILPAGTYIMHVTTNHYDTAQTKTGAFDYTHSVVLGVLGQQHVSNIATAPLSGTVSFTLTEESSIIIVQACNLDQLVNGMGYPASLHAQDEVYLTANVVKIN